MKKKIMIALLCAGAVTTLLSASASRAEAFEHYAGEPCTTSTGKCGYMVASGEDWVCEAGSGQY